ncbi:transcription initiation factor TFIID subunit 13 [Entomortierella parvispora]|uniref:Transcription initiation factor TFIID subunit 13 n=1 Tax=Entomortierella parvispora TaxID=205924 RepID=A0A9P3LW28_9FUNG|nr:transcription initiation factor TFIID subunit 13 [Entomortierella parvispora]
MGDTPGPASASTSQQQPQDLSAAKKPPVLLGRPPGSTNEPRNKRRKYAFAKELKQLMYGFGDVPNPSNDAVNVLEDMLIEYLTDTCTQAAAVAEKRGKVNVEDFRFVLRKDAKKRSRVDELLYMNEDIRRAKKIADIPELDNTKGGAKDAPI